MANSYRQGTTVRWNWGTGTATGQIAERFERKVSRTIKGKRIRRNGTADNPAYVICQDDGTKLLKRGSELEKA
ncbi:DUF2945 domain-containing protein [Novosphingobium sp. PC22D]|uniref:DUF2945 domain-containing protein n=1 Tax=Novosphingobium sp. PC22D TaxID=1962403 RepID=UPI000BEF35F5|nr:DUF2945 domain-containing protein [Novosphingobium sp. PC22D]PEQ11905.1 DUF2945 domain-containing protein [Novosphingobium sp. PC22D]